MQEADWDLSRALNSHFAGVCKEAEARLEAAAQPPEDQPSTLLTRVADPVGSGSGKLLPDPDPIGTLAM